MVIEFKFENKKLKKFSGGNIIESGFSFLKQIEKPLIRNPTKEEEEFIKQNLIKKSSGSGFVEVTKK